MRRLRDYRSWIFDCDGVLLDSNKIKRDAFGQAVASYGGEYAQLLMEYHKKNGGLSRFRKFEYFFSDILKSPVTEDSMAEILNRFSALVYEKLLRCERDLGVIALNSRIGRGVPRIVVSGAAQTELRDILNARGLDAYFDFAFGSPDTKYEIISREIARGFIKEPAILIGDSLLDYDVAATFGFEFVFVTHWTEFDGWQDFFADKQVTIAHDLLDFASRFG